MSLIAIDNISAGYKNSNAKENVIEKITLNINAGELIGVVGENGSGKTTLAKAICNIIPHSGKVQIANKIVEQLSNTEVARNISYVPQQSGLSIDISVLDVVLMGYNQVLKPLEYPSEEMKAKATKMLNQVGLSDKINDNYMQLSEGQKRLAILARAFVNEGIFLVMDEPESALDYNVRYRNVDIIRKWILEGERAGLIILHDIMLALNSCDKLVLLKNKKIVGIIDVHSDTIEEMEDKLKIIFGNISIFKIKNKGGNDRYIMVNESEDI